MITVTIKKLINFNIVPYVINKKQKKCVFFFHLYVYGSLGYKHVQ